MAKPIDDNITITICGDDYESPDSYIYSGSDSITLSGLDDANLTIGGSGNTYPWNTTALPWTTGTGITAGDWNNGISPKIRLDGKDADIEINGESLVGMLRSIQERVNILTVNPKLESEWEELRELGEKYRALEKHILEKQATWDKLKAMPPPEID